MRIFSAAVLLTFFCAAFFVSTHGTPQSQNIKSLPAEVSEFYSDYNFVCSFSTQAERKKLVSYFNQEDLPDVLSSGRLDEIFHLMKKLYKQIDFIDPRMVIRVTPKASRWANVFRSEMYIIEHASFGKEKGMVEVNAFELEPEMISKFISQYEKGSRDEAVKLGPGGRLELIKTRIVRKREIHKWRFRNNRWLKDEAMLLFLKR
jgi:hypothetical protein